MDITQLDEDNFEDLTNQPNYPSIGTNIQTIEEIEVSHYQPVVAIKIPNYHITITPDKNQTDLNLLQNQYYQTVVDKRTGQNISKNLRRFSDFAALFDILFKKYAGYIFPAFPENGIFAFMKTKVTVAKDQKFINARIKVIERFFNIIFALEKFSPETCTQLKVFFSEEKQFEVFKQFGKQKSSSLAGMSWNLVKNYFKGGKDYKYKDIEDGFMSQKKQFEIMLERVKQLVSLLSEEIQLNQTFPSMKISTRQTNADEAYDIDQIQSNLHKITEESKLVLVKLEQLQFQIFCDIEDIMMAKRVIDYMEELKNNQENYKELRTIQETFRPETNRLANQKKIKFSKTNDRFNKIGREIATLGKSYSSKKK